LEPRRLCRACAARRDSLGRAVVRVSSRPGRVTVPGGPRTLTAIGTDPAITGEPREEPPTVRLRARAQ